MLTLRRLLRLSPLILAWPAVSQGQGAYPASSPVTSPLAEQDWPSVPQPSSRYVRFGMTYDDHRGGILLRNRAGFEAALGTLGAEHVAFRWYQLANPLWYLQRFGWQTTYSYTGTRSWFYDGLVPGRQVTMLSASLAAAPTMRLGETDRLALSVLGGVGGARFNRHGAPGEGDLKPLYRPQYVAGGELRVALTRRAHLTFVAKDLMTQLQRGDLTGGTGGRTALEHSVRFGVGLSFHEARFEVPGYSLDRFPRADRTRRDPVVEPLVASVPRLIGHIDGEAENGSARASGRYLGPQSMTFFFGDTSIAVPRADLPRLKRVAEMLAETPGTVIILRGFDQVGESRTWSQRMGEARAAMVRDIILSYAPGVNPQRVSVIAYGADDGVTDPAKARRVELQYFR